MKNRDPNAARALLSCISVIAWIAFIACQRGSSAWYPSSTLSESTITMTASIGFA
ncbi:MAG TPA: hypothetical protein VKM55_06315 [Candidatus Lokiarchaeia archaeon]|nr:hypothetical protein [Candidatus Lokiarchaeia archaeon]